MGLSRGWIAGTGPFQVDGQPPQTPPDVVPWWTTDDDDAARISERSSLERLRQAAVESVGTFLAYGTEPVAELPVVPWWTLDDELVRPVPGGEWMDAISFWEVTEPPPEGPPDLGRFVDLSETSTPPVGTPELWVGGVAEPTERDGDVGRFADFTQPLPVQGDIDFAVGTTFEATQQVPAAPDLGRFCDFTETSPLAVPLQELWAGRLGDEPGERDGEVGRFADLTQPLPVFGDYELSVGSTTEATSAPQVPDRGLFAEFTEQWRPNAQYLGEPVASPSDIVGDPVAPDGASRFAEFAEPALEELRRRAALEAMHLLALLGEPPISPPPVEPFWPELDLLKVPAPVSPDLPLSFWVADVASIVAPAAPGRKRLIIRRPARPAREWWP